MNIGIIGAGNVATHLIKALSKTDSLTVYSRTESQLMQLEKDFEVKTEVKLESFLDWNFDIIILAIPDDVIHPFSECLRNTKQLIVHTSGSVPMDDIQVARRGVFYPLQSFSKSLDVDWHPIPICIESRVSADLELLKNLGNKLSSKVIELNSAERKLIHLGAVMVNNFTNHLAFLTQKFLSEENLDFEMLKPLIEETFRKILNENIRNSQTGPAVRSDQQIQEEHLKLLEGHGIMQKIYNLVSQSIQDEYQK
jgi:predicted short-subunit dehydrogenase-like oxidoreductase (DUF2520 family)